MGPVVLDNLVLLFLFLGAEPEFLYFRCLVMEMGRGLSSKKKLADMILDFYVRQAGVDAYGLGSVAASEKV
jgi:hypothetical protein